MNKLLLYFQLFHNMGIKYFFCFVSSMKYAVKGNVEKSIPYFLGG